MEQPSILERLRAFNRWTKGWAASIAVAVGIWMVLRSYLIEAFRIPSASMENTLLVGDFLFVNKAIYGGELEIPFTGIRCCRLPGYAEPQRDGIVVFRSVEDSTPNLNIVKRVIGGPTDTLQMTHDTVYRNGKRLDEPYALHLGSQPDDPVQLRKIRTLHLPYYVGRDAAHYHPTTHDWGPIAIPPGHYWVRGDTHRVVYPLVGRCSGPAAGHDGSPASGRQLEGLHPAPRGRLGHSGQPAHEPHPPSRPPPRADRDQPGPAHVGPGRGARDRPGGVRGEPLQLLARSTDLDPRVRGPLGLRGARDQGAGGRDPADAARRTGPAHEPGARRRRSHRDPARLGVGAVRQRIGRRDQHLDRPYRSADRPSGCARPVRDLRPRLESQLEQVAVEHVVPRRLGQRLGDAVAARLHGPAAALGC